jgi:5-methyltetrahydrofolate--homocysteine methyltransferase
MEALKQQIQTGNAQETASLVRKYLEEGRDPEAILKQGMIPAMDVVGERFQKGEFFLPEMLIAARAMKEGLKVLKPRLVQVGAEPAGRVVLGTVQGDLHDIGKNLVAMTLEGAGFEVIDLGIDVPSDRIVAAVREHRPLAVGLSALLTTTMLIMRETVEALERAGLREGTRILIGGAPVTGPFAEEIGADFYGPDPTAGKNFLQGLLR